jgi:hypothetical protein
MHSDRPKGWEALTRKKIKEEEERNLPSAARRAKRECRMVEPLRPRRVAGAEMGRVVTCNYCATQSHTNESDKVENL